MNLLVLLLVVPLIGSVACALSPGRLARQMALFFSLLTLFVAGLLVWRSYVPGGGAGGGAGVAFPEYAGAGLPAIGFTLRLGVDGVSLWLVLLTAFLQPLAVAASFGSIKEREREYYGWMMALLVAMLGVFVARDLLLFYVFFELTLVPMFFIIGIWGGPERRYAANKFFLFTFAGSVFTLAAVVYLGLRAGTFQLFDNAAGGPTVGVLHFAQEFMSDRERFWLAIGLLAGFAVKVPLFPVHTWLPLAHTEAPTAGSVILAGVLLKLGTYGLFRLALPIGLSPGFAPGRYVPTLMWWLGLLCVIGVIYGALVAWVQQDIKKLVAYSSVSHLGFCVLGLIALNDVGIQGSVLYMINHGINTGALFLCIGMIYDRYHTRDINQLSGLARRMPILAFFFVLFSLASIGLPGTNGFVSEFLTILGAFTSIHLGIPFGSLAALGIILGAIYILHMVARVIWGPLKTPAVHGFEVVGVGHTAHGTAVGQADQGQAADAGGHGSTGGHGGVRVFHHDDHGKHGGHGHDTPGDIGGREIAILLPLAVAVIVLGVKPGLVMDSMLTPVQQVRAGNPPVVPVPAPRATAGGPQVLPVGPSGSTPAAHPAPGHTPTTGPATSPETTPATAPATPATGPTVPATGPATSPAAPDTLPSTAPSTAPATAPVTSPASESPAARPEAKPGESKADEKKPPEKKPDESKPDDSKPKPTD